MLILDWNWDLHVAQNLTNASDQMIQIFREQMANVSNPERLSVSDFSWINNLI